MPLLRILTCVLVAACIGACAFDLSEIYPNHTAIDKKVVTETKRVSLAKTVYVAPNGEVLCEEDADSMSCMPYILARHGRKDLNSARLFEVDSGKYEDVSQNSYQVLLQAPNGAKGWVDVGKSKYDALTIGQKLVKQQ